MRPTDTQLKTLAQKAGLILFLISLFPLIISFRNIGSDANFAKLCKTNTDTLYKPLKKQLLLFYIQLSENHNIIVYDINYNPDKSINIHEPVHTYWIRYSDKGQFQELTYFQKHLVYGLEPELVDREKQNFVLRFVSYKKKKIYLKRSEKDLKYSVFTDIQGKIALLSKIFIQVESGRWGLPKVRYVELHGRELLSGKLAMEKIIP